MKYGQITLIIFKKANLMTYYYISLRMAKTLQPMYNKGW